MSGVYVDPREDVRRMAAAGAAPEGRAEGPVVTGAAGPSVAVAGGTAAAQHGQSPDGDRSAAAAQPQAAGAVTNPGAATVGVAGVAPGAPHNIGTVAGVAPGAPHSGAGAGVAGGDAGFKSTAYWGNGDPYRLPNTTPMGADGKPAADIAAYVTPIEQQLPYISTLRAKENVTPEMIRGLVQAVGYEPVSPEMRALEGRIAAADAPGGVVGRPGGPNGTTAAAEAAQMQYSRLLDEQIAAMVKQRDALNDEDDARRQRRERYENRQRMAAAIVDGLTSLANVGGAYYGATPIQINQNATHLANVNRGIQQLAAQRQQIRDHRSKIDQRLTELLVKRSELAQDYSKSRNEDARKDAELKLKQNKDAREQAAEGRAVDLHPMAVKAAGLENDYTQIKIDYEKELLKWLPKEKATSIASALASKTLSNARANQIKNGTMRVEFDGGGNLKKEVYTVPSDGEYKAN